MGAGIFFLKVYLLGLHVVLQCSENVLQRVCFSQTFSVMLVTYFVTVIADVMSKYHFVCLFGLFFCFVTYYSNACHP